MIFKNLMLYQLTQPAEIYFDLLREKTAHREFVACTPSQAQSVGFVPPADGELTHEQSGAMMLAVQVQEKKIPGSALRDLVDEKVKQIETEQERKVYRKERLNIKDEILLDKLPSVIPTNKRIYAYIDTKLNMILVDTSSPGTGELVLNLIRECIGSLPAMIPQVNTSPGACMTRWLQGISAGFFELGNDCDLAQPGSDGGKIQCRGVDLANETESHIEAGMVASMLRVSWNESITVSIKDQQTIKAIKFFDALIQGVQDDAESSEDDVTRFDADMALMVGTFREFVPALGGAFGGWLEQKLMNV